MTPYDTRRLTGPMLTSAFGMFAVILVCSNVHSRIIVLGRPTTYSVHVRSVKASRTVHHRISWLSYSSGVMLTAWAAGLSGPKTVGILFRQLGMSWPSYPWEDPVETWNRPYPSNVPQGVTFPNWAARDRERFSSTCANYSAYHHLNSHPLAWRSLWWRRGSSVWNDASAAIF